MRMRALQKLTPLPTATAEQAFDELELMMKGLQVVRTNVVHAVIMPANDTADPTFELRSRSRRFTKAQVFETEELTNYAAHAALVLRDELGDKDPVGAPGPLPPRPEIPGWFGKLQKYKRRIRAGGQTAHVKRKAKRQKSQSQMCHRSRSTAML
jgi:hypothetical protein